MTPHSLCPVCRQPLDNDLAPIWYDDEDQPRVHMTCSDALLATFFRFQDAGGYSRTVAAVMFAKAEQRLQREGTRA